MKIHDLIIIGAGPVGLYAAYYAGMRGLSVQILENFDEVGGQPYHLYPEKKIFDIAGIPEIKGSQLRENLLAQLELVSYDLACGVQVLKVERREDLFEISTSVETYLAKSLLVTTGNGLLKPRLLQVEGEVVARESGLLSYFVKNIEDYRDKKVAIFGGGDSALDWSLMLEGVASEVHLIHRRNEFRAIENTVAQLENSKIQLHTPYVISALVENQIILKKIKADDEPFDLNVDKILVFHGFMTENNQIVESLDLSRTGKIRTGVAMRTNLTGIYAAGDACDYEGKLPLISVGFGEAAIAINDIAKNIDFGHKIRNGHSSSLFAEKQ
ncbi:MAG: NAD(P)/FAD-dependent oxidoreductase [Streptococcaceae bacterium]|jgi:thioredoxin reductase (NADPH)|nr:NAD(P)/FAD-dependent oxidoreductase [Streptococcaceae bacterium]